MEWTDADGEAACSTCFVVGPLVRSEKCLVALDTDRLRKTWVKAGGAAMYVNMASVLLWEDRGDGEGINLLSYTLQHCIATITLCTPPHASQYTCAGNFWLLYNKWL